MTRALSAILILLAATTVAQAASKIPAPLKAVEDNYAKAGTIYAQIQQSTYSSMTKTTKESSGDIVIQRPNKIRWQTLKPDPSFLVSDGKRAWLYTPPPPEDVSEPGQYSEVPASQIRSKLASALLSGQFSESTDLSIQAVSNHEFVLKPKTGTAGNVLEARIEIDSKSKTITRVQLKYSDGNTADMHLSGIKLGEKYSPDTFVFKAPPNTVKIDP
jgi:outer membrane lipoprotein carrier protein